MRDEDPHFSDLHIGVENYGRIDPETGLSTRLGDFLDSLDQVVDFALNDGVDLVLLAGDAYKARDPTQTHQREFAKRLNRLSQSGIPTFLLVGNHDLPAVSSRATALDIFSDAGGRQHLRRRQSAELHRSHAVGPAASVGCSVAQAQRHPEP